MKLFQRQNPDRQIHWYNHFREWLALKIAPWLENWNR